MYKHKKVHHIKDDVESHGVVVIEEVDTQTSSAGVSLSIKIIADNVNDFINEVDILAKRYAKL